MRISGERINGMVGRRSWLLALATLSALLAVAALTLAPARAEPPDDLALSLSLIGDSDNVVPAGSELQVAAKLSYTGADTAEDLRVTGGTLRVSGSHEWESNGRSSLPVEAENFTSNAFAQTGWAVAVDERTPAEGGDIVIVGAPADTAGGNVYAGSADLFVGGQFVKRLTAGDDAAAGAGFGIGVDVAGGYIVVGASGENGPIAKDSGRPVGAVYIFDDEGNQIAKLTPGDPGDQDPRGWPIDRFGEDVAIDDAGETIVVAAKSSKAQTNTSTTFVFTKPAGGWANMSTDDSSVRWLSSNKKNDDPLRYRFAAPSGVDISADGNTIVQVFENAFKSIIAVREKPPGGWANANTAPVTLDTMHDQEQLRPGETVAISDNGDTIAASGVTRYARDQWGAVKTNIGMVHAYAGGAYVWERDGSSWAAHDDHDAWLTDHSAANGDMFGHTVAISGDGSKVAVSDAWGGRADDYPTGKAHVFTRPGAAGSWADNNGRNPGTAPTVLTSPQSGNRLFFGWGLAIDGGTLIVGQSETVRFIMQETGVDQIETDHGRAFTFDLSNLEQPGTELSDCTTSMADETTTYTCGLITDDVAMDDAATITIPAGTPDGTFTISGSVNVDGGAAAYTASLVVTIGTVDEVAEVAFDFAADSDGAEYPSIVPLNDPDMPAERGKTVLQLAVLNENGTASAAGNIASVLITTTSGTLRLAMPMGSGCTGGSGLACQVDVDDLDATNSDAIQVELTHPGQSGTATVSARVLSLAGASFAPDPLEIIFSGGPETYTISEPATSLLNVATTDEGDDRDVLTLSITAEDKSGNRAVVPTTPSDYTVRFKDPDGKTAANVTARVKIDRDENDAPKLDMDDDEVLIKDAAGNPQVEIIVGDPAADALATGDYTLEVRIGSKTATQTINVSAGAAAVALSLDGAAEIGQRVTVTAAITDADGAAVADGTPVTFTEGSAQATPALVRVSAQTKTTDGAASAVYLVVASGTAFVTVGSGDSASDVLLIQTAQPTPEAVPPAESLSSTAANSYSSYMGAAAATASELLAGLEGLNGILLWDGSAWLRYSVVDGREVPGSVNFEITMGAILWLSG